MAAKKSPDPQKPADKVAAAFPHYYKDTRHLEKVDVYRVLDLYKVTDPSIAHATKKLLCSGGRGAKDQITDIKEAIAALERFLDMQEENSASLS